MGQVDRKWKPQPVAPPNAPIAPPPAPVTEQRILTAKLSWELPCADKQVAQGAHPERAAWSDYLAGQIWQNLQLFLKATDINTVFPDWRTLSNVQQCTKLAELFCQMAKFESGWRPAITSIPVGGSMDPKDAATGFFQLNESDQKNYQTGTSFTHEELKDPLNNIKAGVGIVVHLLKVKNRITFTKGLDHGYFFETLLFGAKYDSIEVILAAVDRLKV